METPQISVLLPARNAAATLREAAGSMLAQVDAPPLELVLIDDRSTDATRDVATGVAARDSRVRVIDGPGEGLVAALNFGLTQCRAPLLARMDADDLARPDRLRLQHEWLEAHPRAGAVGTRVRMIPRPLTPGLARFEEWLDSVITEEECSAARFVESPLVHPSILFRREALDAVGGYRDAGWAEDWDLLLRIHAAGFTLGKVPELLLDWRDSPERLTRTGSVYRPERMVALRASFLSEGPLRDRAFDVWGAGPTGKELARALEAHGRFPDRFIDIDPRKKMARGKRVIQASELGPPEGKLIVCAVGAAGARETIREHLLPLGYLEERDFLFAA